MSERAIENPTSGVDRCHYLLASLLAVLLLNPVLGQGHTGSIVLDLFVSSTLLLTVRALRGPKKGIYRATLVLCVLAVSAAAASHLFKRPEFLPLGHGLGLLFFLLTGITLLGRALEPGHVTASRLQAAVCAYLLIGLGWALAFSVLEHAQPGAFHDPSGGSPHDHAVLAGFPHLIYYSFTTLTTLGFGDIVPKSPLARALTTIEAVMGQLYLALLVARLVGLHNVRLAATQEKN